MNTKLSIINCLVFASLLLAACNDEESALGLDLTDSTTLYAGITDTLYASEAWTEHEDSLMTSNYSLGAIGHYRDNTFGKVSSTLYTQIALPTNATDITFDGSEMIIDSVVLRLAKYQLFPDTMHTYAFHFEVKQLAEALPTDTTFYSHDVLPVKEDALFFDEVVNVGYADSVVSLRLDTSVNSLLRRSATAEQFIEETKGLRIRITDDSEEGMMSIDFSSTNTALVAYYHTTYGVDSSSSSYTFLMGAGTAHFTHFEHDYSGTVFAGGGRVDGSQRLYLEPMGGQEVRLSFDSAIKAFHQSHPLATIHHAELQLPVASEARDNVPDMLLTLSKDAAGQDSYVDDLINAFTMRGYDGAYHTDSAGTYGYYRMRISQHVQGLLRQNGDPGMLLLLNSRRHAAQRAVLNGIGTADCPRLIIVYSE